MGMGDALPKPTVQRTVGQRPACLVNASITYVGNNQLIAFGGFDQYTDEGKSSLIGSFLRYRLADILRQSTTTYSSSI